MKYLIEIGTDGGDGNVVGWCHDMSGALTEVSRIVGLECFVKIPPIKRTGQGALFNFEHEGKTKWIRVKKIPAAEMYPTIDGAKPLRDYSNCV